jgi:hypothetical protein
MNRLENVEDQVRHLTTEELAAFRSWFAEFEADLWDRQLEEDARDGKLDSLAQRALRDHAAGKSTEL